MIFLEAPRHQRHIVVENGLLVAIIPFDGHARPIDLGNRAEMFMVCLPANAITSLQLSRLFARHSLLAC